MHNSTAIDSNDLLLELYRLSNQSPIGEFQDQALALLNRAVKFDASMWGTAEIRSEGLAPSTLHLQNKHPEIMQEYEQVKHLDKAAASMFLQPRTTRGFHGASMYTEPHEREKRAFSQRHEHNNVFITAARSMDVEFIHWISLYRADETHYCSEEDIRRLAQLAPHLMQALAFNRMKHLADIWPTRGTKNQQYGSAIADFRGVLLHANEIFCAMLETEWGTGMRHALPHQALLHFTQGHTQFTGHSMVLQHHVEHGMLFLFARPKCRADSLTAREITVARMASKGASYKEIAQSLNRAPATVRNHMQSIYQKLEVSHIAELIDALQQTGFHPRA